MNSFFVRFVLVFAAVFCVIFLLVWFYLSVTSMAQAADVPPGAPGESVSFETGRISIVTGDGLSHDFEVEFAITSEQQRRGLMFRQSLNAGHGMMFDYNPPRRIAMWMKNTSVSLDMLFFDVNGRVVHIAPHTMPFSLDLIPAPTAVRYVLEVPAGTASKLGLMPGDRLQLR